MTGAGRAVALAGLVLLQVMLLHSRSAGCQPLKLEEPVTYAHYYADDNARANPCKVVHNVTKPGLSNSTGYVPFIGTSISRDSQLLILRLYHSLQDYPVKQFVVVVPERALSPPQGAMWYQLQHLKEYGDNVMIISCVHAPSVAEGWNAVFQVSPHEPWGVYCARDTHWMPGSLEKLAGHMWNASRDSTFELALMNWTFPIGLGQYNAFAFTRSALNRFGLFDENLYPSFYEDNDFQLRQQRLVPPLKLQGLPDVFMHHGKPQDTTYMSGVSHTPDHEPGEHHLRRTVHQRFHINAQYLFRKWGCKGQRWFDCDYKTPFNKSLPVWYWYSSRHQRQLDYGIYSKENKVFDGDGNLLYDIPGSYAGWAGYNDSAHTCRLTGPLGVVNRTGTGVWCV
ncbi:hypothetical protein COO60DRAFT_1553242 [Scenedesmus sp. NREL 46B-D3]|nr:hypothetical protein COO60DRAFT_1553242 [Scenedesmus sp. NREL 46B-D3]